MTTHEAHEARSPTGRPRPHRLLPIAGITLAVVAVLAHLAGGAALLHVGLGGALASLGFGGGALVVGLAAVIALKLLAVFGARRWLRRR